MNRSLLNTEAAIQNLHHIANADQPSIPANVLERITQASENRVSENISALPAAYDIKEYLQAAAPNDSDSIEVPATRSSETLKMEAYDRKLRSGELFARRRIDGIKENQRQIAKQLSSIRSDGHDKSQERLADKVATVPTSTLDKVRTRLSELEQISKDINKNIDHIDAVVAIKDNYLHQLRTAETLLARYNAAQTSGDDGQMDQAEIFHAAYTVIMHNVPRRYNPEANNKDGHETIAQVIARLEDEVSDLNSKAAEERFEVGLEKNILETIRESNTTISQDTLLEMLDRYMRAYRNHFAGDNFPFDGEKLAEIKAKTLYKLGKILLNVNNAAVDAKHKGIQRRELPPLK